MGNPKNLFPNHPLFFGKPALDLLNILKTEYVREAVMDWEGTKLNPDAIFIAASK